ncbi:MAG: carbohydrate kinase family protein [Gammaproteobacteria bacterium]
MSALICGALAFDTIMGFEGRFGDQILPEEIDRLSVSFPVPKMRREFGGCAGNIAYNLSLLGETGLPQCVVGHDFGDYARWLDRNGISRRYVRELASEFTAQAFITSDCDGNQITAFHPGAMAFADEADLPEQADFTLGVIAPDDVTRMRRAASYFARAGVAFVFDPGQFMTSLDATQMLEFVELADWVTMNDYEAGLLTTRTGQTLADLSRRARALIVTHGKNGSQVWRCGQMEVVPAAQAGPALDPTGCGDAYRAGLAFGLLRELPFATTVRVASLMGALAVEHFGTQNHRPDATQIARRYEESFGEPLALMPASGR